MNFNLYIFGNPNGKYSQIPKDYLASDIIDYQSGLKGARLIIMRRMDLMHYIYMEKFNAANYIGFCLIFNRAYILHPKKLCSLFKDIIEDYFVRNGDIIRYSKDGNLLYNVSSLGGNMFRYQKTFELINDALENKSEEYGVKELKSIFNGEHSSRTISFTIPEEQIVQMSLSYNTLVIDDSEYQSEAYIPKVIAGLNDKVALLTKQNAQLHQQNEILNRQKKQMKWVLVLLSVILVGCLIFYNYAQNKKREIQSITDENIHLDSVIVDKNNNISSLNSSIKSLNDSISSLKTDIKEKNSTIRTLNTSMEKLKADSIKSANELSKKSEQIYKVKQKISNVHKTLNNDISAYINFEAWQSTNKGIDKSKSQITYSFYAYKDDILNIPYYVSSEDKYDFLTITLKRNGYSAEQLVHLAGVHEGTRRYTFSASDSYLLIVEYSKDTNHSRNNDNAGVKKFYIYRPIVERLREITKYTE